MSKASRLALYIFLMLTVFGMTIGVLYFLLMRNDFLAQNPGVEPYFNLYVGSALVSILGAIALLKVKKWGFWLYTIGMLAALGIEIAAEVELQRIIRIPLALLTLFLLLRWNKRI